MTRDPAPSAAQGPTFLDRSRGLFTDAELRRLGSATVAIAGVGGVGGRVAEVLARSGIGNLRLADPDTFSITNLNRQAASTLDSLGRQKTTVVAELCRSVSPIVTVDEWSEGVSAGSIDAFVRGADAVVDGTDFTLPSLGLLVARAGSAQHVPVALGVEVAFGAWHTVFTRPGQFEQLMGLPLDVSPETLDSGEISVPLWRWVQRVPPYLNADVFARVARGEIDAPAIAPAVEISAAMLATDVLQLVLGRRPATRAPAVHGIDARTGRSWRGRPSMARFMLSAKVASWRARR